MEYILICITAIFVNNIVLSQFLGICPFLGVSQRVNTALGMSAAVAFVMTLATVVTYMLQIYVLNPMELGYLQNYINQGYELFRKRVADGRKMSVEEVEANAQGHVFTGEDALKLKLVDELGGLDKAIAKAAQLAKLDEYYTAAYPAQPSLLDQLLSTAKGGNYLDDQMRLTLGSYYEPFMLLRETNQMSPVQARLPYFLNIH